MSDFDEFGELALIVSDLASYAPGGANNARMFCPLCLAAGDCREGCPIGRALAWRKRHITSERTP